MKLVLWEGRRWIKLLRLQGPLHSEDEKHPTPALTQGQVFFRKTTLKFHCVSELEAHEIITLLVFTSCSSIDWFGEFVEKESQKHFRNGLFSWGKRREGPDGKGVDPFIFTRWGSFLRMGSGSLQHQARGFSAQWPGDSAKTGEGKSDYNRHELCLLQSFAHSWTGMNCLYEQIHTMQMFTLGRLWRVVVKVQGLAVRQPHPLCDFGEVA